ncbi:hypothetical protein CC1G_04418 [Coprinopsis cinerea okayama7|uniref:Maintenance of telomere capping protein 1 n=1 Tax=Coprinopsis cinerea (strain Okayama-7 / 130 / ATCC MYA-4618 / FGSC 9003) TaxID=240176 RepID=A8N0J7_COPC7|nr:hypothetical protein CC1G_04418 [Coprinopsis cinerea okayama7\|eukprot:XP_001828447.1 hypothetical protein CC1G_04418 [Coprinopsis cinerea okayama7\
MTSKSKKDEALQFLDDLDSFTPVDQPKKSNSPPAQGSQPQAKGNEAEVLAFIDEITQKSTEPTRTASQIGRSGTPTIRKSTERVRLGGGPAGSNPSASSSTTSLHRTASTDGSKQKAESSSTTSSPQPAASTSASGGGWGWGSVWSTATAAIQQAKSAVDEQVKHLPNQEQVAKLREGVLEYAKNAQLDKLGQDFKRVGLSTLTDILNVVAPPIAEHEVIQIWLSHDMQGYEGVETVVYRSFSKVMEQVQGGDLVVNRGNESKPKESSSGARELNAVEGTDAALKLAKANIESMVKNNANLQSKPSNITSPTTYSNVYLRIQPFFTSSLLDEDESEDDSDEDESDSDDSTNDNQKLQFLIYLHDPEHKLTSTSVTQGVPASWLAIWEEYDWVEDLVADGLRLGVEVIGQEYLVSRQGWANKPKDTEEEAAEAPAPEQAKADKGSDS